jgi:hypothetical protein
MSFTGGAHKSITGSYTFFGNNVEENMGALGHHVGLTGSSAVYVVMSGRFTPSQRTIVRKRCLVEVENFKTIEVRSPGTEIIHHRQEQENGRLKRTKDSKNVERKKKLREMQQ